MTPMWVSFLLGILVSSSAAMALYFFLQNRRGQRPETAAITQTLFSLQKEISNLQLNFQSQILELSQQVNQHLQSNAKFLEQSQSGFHQTVHQVQEKLGYLQEATKNMLDIGKDISALQNILQAPKLRGGMGELFLGELLEQILPQDHFALQYQFQTGSMVDAVIFLGQGMIPVDSKFPLENFRRIFEAPEESAKKAARKSFQGDVKKHIDAIASKYIVPTEGTFDFALMYIPAENVYYEVIIKDEFQTESISAYALSKKVIPVSPNSFYAYLQAIVRGLKGMRIERSAKMILESLGQLETDLEKCWQDMEKVGGHLGNAVSAHQKALAKFSKLKDKISLIEEIPKKSLEDGSAKPAREFISES